MTNKHPRLRSHIRRRKDGSVRVYWFYDMRPEDKPDIPLGHDYDAALVKWDELHNHKPRIAGTLQEAFEQWEREVLPSYENAGTRRTYGQSLRKLKPVFGGSQWADVELSDLKGYLKHRTAKRQGNLEMSLLSVIWNWARGEGMTNLHWPAAGMERSRWKNKEKARKFEVTDALFEAVYAEAEPMLRDCMDLSTATAMRLTDCRTIALPKGDSLPLRASKTGKEGDFDLSLSKVLPDLIARRRALAKAPHTMLLSMPNGKPVTESMLRGAYDRARAGAALKAKQADEHEFASQIRAMFLRDCRKRAADLAGDDQAASDLLQHPDVAFTRKHYRTRATTLKPVR